MIVLKIASGVTLHRVAQHVNKDFEEESFKNVPSKPEFYGMLDACSPAVEKASLDTIERYTMFKSRIP